MNYLKVGKTIIREGELNIRGFKGYGSSHAFIDRDSTNLGMSKVMEKIVTSEDNAKDNKDSNNKKKVKISRAFNGERRDI